MSRRPARAARGAPAHTTHRNVEDDVSGPSHPRHKGGLACASTSSQPLPPRSSSCSSQRRPHRRTPGSSSGRSTAATVRSEEHTSELQSQFHLVCRLLLEKKKYTP